MKKEKLERLDLYSFLQKYPIRNRILLQSMIKSKYRDVLFQFDMAVLKLVLGSLIALITLLLITNLILVFTKVISSDTYVILNIVAGAIFLVLIIICKGLRKLYNVAKEEINSIEHVIDEIDELSKEE